MSTAVNTFDVEAKASSLAPFRSKLRSLLEASGFNSKMTHDLLLSVDEVLTNVIRHAYGGKSQDSEGDKIHVALSDFVDRVEITIEDRGPCFDPLRVPSPKLPPDQPGGLGIHFIRSLTDEVHYESLKPQGNRLRLVKYKKGKERN